MTQWVGDSGVGRPRGPRALVRAWGEIVGRPATFFRSNVAPGDQGPGLTFLAAVVLLEESIRIALVPGSYPIFGGRPVLSAVVWLLVAVVLVAPLGIHLVAAVQTLVLAMLVPDRGGISETVQVLCYASAPCVLAGVPSPWVRSAVLVYALGLYLLGTAIVHGIGPVRSTVAGLFPAAIVFGFGFRGFEAAWTVALEIAAWADTVVTVA